MYTFRFNPVFKQWVALGEPLPKSVSIKEAHWIHPAPPAADFQAAVFPRQPFVLEPERVREGALLYPEHSPTGEYELLTYRGSVAFKDWDELQWRGWLLLLADRVRRLHMNPHLHFVTLKLATKAVGTIKDVQRVGDLIAASHPLAGLSVPIERDLIVRLMEREKLFVLHRDKEGALYVPTAPLHRQELWYLPDSHAAGIEALSSAGRDHVAAMLTYVFGALHHEFPKADWLLTVHTAMAGSERDDSWWIQIHQDISGENTPLPLTPLPERFALTMKHLLAHRHATVPRRPSTK